MKSVTIAARFLRERRCVAAPPAVINAILDALRPLGVTDIEMPATAERIWRAIHKAKSHNT